MGLSQIPVKLGHINSNDSGYQQKYSNFMIDSLLLIRH